MDIVSVRTTPNHYGNIFIRETCSVIALKEIITRWGELGINLNKGQISFAPEYLLDKEYDDNKLSFTRFGIPFIYEKCGTKSVSVTYADGKTVTVEGNTLEGDVVKALFNRSKDITSVKVKI